jgi:hypothetical protein
MPRGTLSLLLALVAGAPAGAHVILERGTLRQWTVDSAAAVVAEFVSDASMWRAGDGSDRQEYFRVRVVATLHGPLEPGPLEFFPHAEGFPDFRAGERALVFLERTGERPEFARLAGRFPWFSTQGAGQEWKLEPGIAGESVLEIARRLASYRAAPPPDPRRALRDVVLAELASGVPRLRRDAIAELVRARGWPGFLDAESTSSLASWAERPALPATERLALVRLLEGAPGFDADARLRAMTGEPLDGRELAQLVRTAGTRSDPALRAWLAALADDPRPEIQREARSALAPHR